MIQCISMMVRRKTVSGREKLVQLIALMCLLAMGVVVVAGPSGLIAWGENQRALEQRRIKLAEFKADQARLQNRVRLFDPSHVDPDLAGELVRRDLNFARPDEMVLMLH